MVQNMSMEVFLKISQFLLLDECDFVIGVNASPLVTEKYKKNIVGIAERSYHFMFRANTIEDKKLCDILVETDSVMQFKTFDLKQVKVIFNTGYEEMKRALDLSSYNLERRNK